MRLMHVLGLAIGSVVAFSAMGDERPNVADLIAWLKGPDPAKSAYAARALGTKGDAAAIPPLVEALSDHRVCAPEGALYLPVPPSDVASVASDSLVRFGPIAVPALVKAVNSRDATVRIAAIEILGPIGAAASDALPLLEDVARTDAREEMRYRAVESYAAIRGRDVGCAEFLTGCLEDASPAVRSLVAQRLGDLGPTAAGSVTALIHASNDTEDYWHFDAPDAAMGRPVRRVVMEALGRIGPRARSAVGMLGHRMATEEPSVRLAAAFALVQIENSPHALNVLIAALGDSGQLVAIRIQAADAIEEIGIKAAPAFDASMRALSHDNPFLRMAVLRAIRSIGGERTVAVLIRSTEDKNSQVRQTAVECLGELGESSSTAVPQLIERLRDDDQFVHQAAAKALGQVGPQAKAAIPHLQQIVNSGDADEHFRNIASEAIGRISNCSITPRK